MCKKKVIGVVFLLESPNKQVALYHDTPNDTHNDLHVIRSWPGPTTVQTIG